MESHEGDAQFFARLLPLASTHSPAAFFPDLHALLRERIGAGKLMCVVAKSGAPGAFETCYACDPDHAGAGICIDPNELASDPGKHGFAVSPLRSDGETIGYLGVAPPRGRAFGAAERACIAAADAAALTVRRAHLRDEANRRSVELRVMLETARALASERDLPKLFGRLHALVDGIMDAIGFYVALGSAEAGKMTIPYCVNDGAVIEFPDSLPIDASLCGYVFRTGEPLLLRTLSDWERYPAVVRGEGDEVISALVVPMRIGARVIGVMSVQSVHALAYGEKDRDLIVAIAEQAAIAVENSQHLMEADLRTRELKLLAEVSRALSAQLTLKALCATVYDEVLRVMDAAIFYVGLRGVDDSAFHIEYFVENGVSADIADQKLENSLAMRVVTSNQPIVLQSSAEIHQQPHRHLTIPDDTSVRSVLMAPLRLGDRCIGVISAQSYREGAYDESSVRLLTAIAEQMAVAVHNAQLFGEAKSRADRDPLTNLFHHRYLQSRLEEEIERSRRFGRPLAVLMIDLDNLKLVNDTYGHPAGDEALKTLTSVLAVTCRATDVIGRYRGDEFMVILPDAAEQQAEAIAERIDEELSSRLLRTEEGTAIPLRCSIGVAVFPRDGSTARDVVGKADVALYQRKRRAKLDPM